MERPLPRKRKEWWTGIPKQEVERRLHRMASLPPPRKIHGKKMYSLLYGATKKEAEAAAETHRKFRRKMGYKSGTAVVKVGKGYAVYSCLMQPKKRRSTVGKMVM